MLNIKCPYLDVVKQSPLTLLAAASLVPAAHLAAGSGEGRVAAEEDVGHHPEAPEVAPLVVHQVLLAVLDEGLHHLWGHKLGAPQQHPCGP